MMKKKENIIYRGEGSKLCLICRWLENILGNAGKLPTFLQHWIEEGSDYFCVFVKKFFFQSLPQFKKE